MGKEGSTTRRKRSMVQNYMTERSRLEKQGSHTIHLWMFRKRNEEVSKKKKKKKSVVAGCKGMLLLATHYVIAYCYPRPQSSLPTSCYLSSHKQRWKVIPLSCREKDLKLYCLKRRKPGGL